MKELRLLVWPALIWLLLFVAGPVLWILFLSFQTRGTYGGVVWEAQLGNYRELLNPTLLSIFLRSLWLAFTTAFICVLLGTLIVWSLMTVSVALQRWLLLLVLLPSLINLIIRIFALRTFFSFDGPVQVALRWVGLEFDPYSLTSNDYLVFLGMITSYLPFSVMPLYAALSRFDFSVFEAAQDLGAGVATAFTRVVLPQMKVALANAFLLVFIPALGEFVIPDLLGGAKTTYLGNLLTDQFLKSRNWPLGSATTVMLILVLVLSVGLFRLSRKRSL